MNTIPRIIIGAAGSGSGKTTLTCALLAHFKYKKNKVVAFKAGPDYIDPMFHQEVLGVPSYNLDLFMLGEKKCQELLIQHGQGQDIAIIEGVMGFYDGIKDTSKGSSAELALKTHTPALLILSPKGMGLSVCAMIKGYLDFEPNTIKGVVLNGITEMSYPYYKNLIEKHTPVRVLGYMPYIEESTLESRHLGLVTAKEIGDLQQKIDFLREKTAHTLDLEGILALGQSAKEVDKIQNSDEKSQSLGKYATSKPVKIAVAKDAAFCFYYEDALNKLESLGAKLIPFSPIKDETLPQGVSGLILGGGYPELYLQDLAANESMKRSIHNALQRGMPCIAECGGFMYLQQGITTLEGKRGNMVGYLEGEATMQKRLGPFGYIQLVAKEDTLLLEKGEHIYAHEFHYSTSTHLGSSCTAQKALDTRAWDCVVASENLFAGYPHLHLYGHEKAAKRFINKCKEYGI
jgi:cobyrinic acid a,c-diamide synthase